MLYFANGSLKTNDLCTDVNANSQSVIDYCKSQNGTLKYRCCFASNSSTILAIDLTDMNLNKVPTTTEFSNLINVTMIDLRLNPKLVLSQEEDFLQMILLDYIFLPEEYSCPGGKRVWQDIQNTMNPKGVACMHQKDFCTNSTDTCVEPHSHCVLNGPDHFLCQCNIGHYGYKCLRHGKFPTVKFFGAAIGITIVLSIFLYFSQRFNIKRD